jgi:ribonucleoside-diphosphate reductase subunit M2
LLIDTYVTDALEKEYLFNAISNVPVIREKAAWAMDWMDPTRPFQERLVAFAAV